jgi:hypothetical protein
MAPNANAGLRRKMIGFRWNAMILHLIDGVPSWQKLVQEFIEAEAVFTNSGLITDLQDFIFKRMGEWWKEGQQHEQKNVVTGFFSIKDPISKDWDEIALTVDVQETHYWHTGFGWRHNGQARLLSCGKLPGEGDILKKQNDLGLRGPQFVFLDATWSPGRRVQKMCAENNWTALVGSDVDGFEHRTNRKDHRGNYVTERKIYSRQKNIDVGMGTHEAGRKFCAQFDFATNVAQGILQERLDRSELGFEIPQDAPAEFFEHLKGMVRKQTVVKSTGMRKWIWADIANGRIHLRDCCNMQMIFAAMAKCISVTLPENEANDATPPTEYR